MNLLKERQEPLRDRGIIEVTRKGLRTLMAIGAIGLSGALAACGSTETKVNAKPNTSPAPVGAKMTNPTVGNSHIGAALPSIHQHMCELLPAKDLPVNTAGNAGMTCEDSDIGSTYSGDYAYVGDNAPLTVVTVAPDPGNNLWKGRLGVDKPGPTIDNYPTLVDNLGDVITEVGQYNVMSLYADSANHAVREENNARIIAALLQAAAH